MVELELRFLVHSLSGGKTEHWKENTTCIDRDWKGFMDGRLL